MYSRRNLYKLLKNKFGSLETVLFETGWIKLKILFEKFVTVLVVGLTEIKVNC